MQVEIVLRPCQDLIWKQLGVEVIALMCMALVDVELHLVLMYVGVDLKVLWQNYLGFLLVHK